MTVIRKCDVDVAVDTGVPTATSWRRAVDCQQWRKDATAGYAI